jgi:hypothetical protein
MDFYNPNEDAFDPSTYEVLKERSFLPRARKESAGGALSQGKADAAFKRYMELAGGQDDYSQAQMQALARSEQANMDDRLAIAAQYAGPKFSGMQESYLKRAMAGREPTRVGNAIIGPDGTVVSDPAANRTKQAELQFRLGQYYSQNADRDEQRAYRNEQQEYDRGRNDDADADKFEQQTYDRGRHTLADRGSIDTIENPATGEIIFYNRITGDVVNSPLGNKPTLQDGPLPQFGFNFPNGSPKLTETQDKNRYYAQMMTAALPDMIKPLKNGYTPTRLDQVAAGPEASGYLGKMANALTPRSSASPLGLQFYTAGRQILAAILRRESGAAITDDEWTNYGPMYLPWPGESKEDINRKMKMISTTIDNVAMGSGPAYRNFKPPVGYDEAVIDDQAPEGFPQAIWDGMSQAEKDEYNAAGRPQ